MPKNGRGCKVKGTNGEREVVELLRSMGYSARRVPLSGSCEGFKGDVLVGERCSYCGGTGSYIPNSPLVTHAGICDRCHGTGTEPGSEEQWEVKRRAGAFKLIDRWLEDAHAVAFRRDRGEWCVVMRLKDLPKP